MGFTVCTEDRPLLLIENAGKVEPCRCGRVFDHGRLRYRHGLPPIDPDVARDAYDAMLERIGLTGPPGCARVGLHNCDGTWRNHDRADDIP